jgi:hypothetical protein
LVFASVISSTPTSRVTLREQAPTKSWGDGVVHLRQNNRGDAVVGIEKAKGGAGGKILNQYTTSAVR